jgi:hypothetical protein
VTSIYLAGADPADAMRTALVVVLAATAACLPAVALLPRAAPPEDVLHGV